MRVYCGRAISADDIETIRCLISQDPNLTRAALSRKLCELWQWLKPNGELKDMTCRVGCRNMPVFSIYAVTAFWLFNRFLHNKKTYYITY